MLIVFLVTFLFFLYVSVAVDPDYMPDAQYANNAWYVLVLLTGLSFALVLVFTLPEGWHLVVRVLIIVAALFVLPLLLKASRALLVTWRAARAMQNIKRQIPRPPSLLRDVIAPSFYVRHWGGLSGGRRFVLTSVQVAPSATAIDARAIGEYLLSKLQVRLPQVTFLDAAGAKARSDPQPGRSMFGTVKVVAEPRLEGIGYLQMIVINALDYSWGEQTYRDGRMGYSSGVSFGVNNPATARNAIDTLVDTFAAEWERLNGESKHG